MRGFKISADRPVISADPLADGVGGRFTVMYPALCHCGKINVIV